jgi:hypothetical protein
MLEGASAVSMTVWHAQAAGGLTFEIELDHHNRFFADDPSVVSWFDRHDLRSTMLDDASVRILDVNLAVDQKADVRVHTQLGADHGLHVYRPPKPGWVHHSLDPGPAGLTDLEQHVADLATLGAHNGREDFAGPRDTSRRPSLRGLSSGRLRWRRLWSGEHSRRFFRRFLRSGSA